MLRATRGTSLILDASALLRGLLAPAGTAAEAVAEVAAMRQPGAAPDVIVAEVVNGLRTLVHANRHTLQQAITTLSEAQSLPIRLHASSMLAQEALLTAIERGLSGYDALYATLSELLGEPLVTADRRLADAVPRSILVA